MHDDCKMGLIPSASRGFKAFFFFPSGQSKFANLPTKREKIHGG